MNMTSTRPARSSTISADAATFQGNAASPDRIAHHFTVDVEEYYQVAALARVAPRHQWSTFESRVVGNTIQLLELLGRHDVRGTFFVLGRVAERHPALVRRIVREGHEVASHGWGHRKVTELTPEEFRQSVRRSRELLEDVTGSEVIGYRAPSFSIIRGLEWTFDVLLEEGYRYDSTLYPVQRPGYGYRGGARDPHAIRRPGGELAEFPPATLRLGPATLPAAGGAYLRLLPYALVSGALRQAERRGAPGTFYIHPWELDPEQPRFVVPLRTRIRHYGGLARTGARLDRLLTEFRFHTIAESITGSATDD